VGRSAGGSRSRSTLIRRAKLFVKKPVHFVRTSADRLFFVSRPHGEKRSAHAWDRSRTAPDGLRSTRPAFANTIAKRKDWNLSTGKSFDVKPVLAFLT
jgi:hypothetical protein